MKNTANRGSFQSEVGEGQAPTQAHMAIQTGALDGDPDSLLAVPKGSHVFFIEDPRIPHTIIECILHKVVYENHQLKRVELFARSADRRSTRKLTLEASWSGEFKSTAEAAHKAADQRIIEVKK